MVKAFESIPVAPHPLPVLGHLAQLVRKPLSTLSSLVQYGDVVRLRAGLTDVVVVCDPSLTTQVLRNDKVFDKGGFLNERAREVVGDGVATCPYDHHRRQRRLVQPAFHQSRLPGYAEVMVDQADAVVGGWRDGQAIDVLPEMMQISTRVMLVTMFSDALLPGVVDQAVADIRHVVNGVGRRMFSPPLFDRLPTRGKRRHYEAIARLRGMARAVVEARRGSGDDVDDLLSLLLQSQDVDDSRFSDVEIADQAVTFFITGSETVASTLAWALNELVTQPDIQRRVQEEVDRVVGAGPVRYEHLPELELTELVIIETLRLRSPSWIFTRITRTDVELGGYHIPAGTTVVYSHHLLHHREDLHVDPERFDPSRWDGASTTRNDTYIPFGGGPRKCIGDNFAMAEAIIVLASVLARWRVTSTPDRDLRPVLSAVMKPRMLRLRVAARDSTSRNDTSERTAQV